MMKQQPSSDSSTSTPTSITIEPITAGVWFSAWLFTIGFAHLSFWKGALALILWPYLLGARVG